MEDASNRESRERTRRAWGRLGIHCEEYKAKDRELKNLTSERKAKICERKVVMAKKKTLSILRSLSTD